MLSFKEFITELYSVHIDKYDFEHEDGEKETLKGATPKWSSVSKTKQEKTVRIPMHKITSRNEGDGKEDHKDHQDHINNIAKTLKSGGGTNPILVRRHPKTNGYQVVDGHHRYYAHKRAGLKYINVHIIPHARITGPHRHLETE